MSLRELVILGKFSAIFYKGNNFYDFMRAILYKSLLNWSDSFVGFEGT